jgi:hypothetical protein
MRHTVLAFAFTAAAFAPARAQTPQASPPPAQARAPQEKRPLDARAFVPADYLAEIFVDVKALRDQEILEGLSSSTIGPLLKMMERAFGFAPSNLDTLRVFPPVEGQPRVQGQREAMIGVFTGNEKVCLPVEPPDADTTLDTIAGCKVAIHGAAWYRDDPDLCVCVRPGLLAFGPRHFLAPVLEGTAASGVPPGEFLSLAAGKGVVAYVIVALTDKALEDRTMVPEGAVCADDKPRFLVLRVRSEPGATPDDEPVLVLEAIVRCDNGKQGPARLAAIVKEGLQAAQKHPRLSALKRYWTKIEVAVDGRDVRARLPIGRPREAAGNLALLAAPLLLGVGVRTEVTSATVVEPGDPTPPPAPPPIPQGRPAGGGGR